MHHKEKIDISIVRAACRRMATKNGERKKMMGDRCQRWDEELSLTNFVNPDISDHGKVKTASRDFFDGRLNSVVRAVGGGRNLVSLFLGEQCGSQLDRKMIVGFRKSLRSAIRSAPMLNLKFILKKTIYNTSI